MDPCWKAFAKWVSWSPHRLRREGVVIAGNEKYRRMGFRSITERFGETLPKIRRRCGVIKQISCAEYSTHRVASSNIENPRYNFHPSPRQLLLRFFRERRKPPSEVPIGGVQELQHYVSVFRGVIRKVTWNSRVI